MRRALHSPVPSVAVKSVVVKYRKDAFSHQRLAYPGNRGFAESNPDPPQDPSSSVACLPSPPLPLSPPALSISSFLLPFIPSTVRALPSQTAVTGSYSPF
eukprot:756786-Hanusia_phi.AAC.6